MWIVGGVVVLGLVVIFSSPSSLDLDDSCRPAKTLNVIRSEVQRGRYWKSQLVLVNQEVRAMDEIPGMRAEADSFDAAARKEDSTYYTAHPDEHERFVPSRGYATNPESRLVPERAAAFRDSADAIELAYARTFVDSLNGIRRVQLSVCRDSISRRAQR